MSDEDRQMCLPWGHPTTTGPEDRVDDLRAEARTVRMKVPNPVAPLSIASNAYDAFIKFRETSVSPEQSQVLQAAMHEMLQDTINKMGTWELPESMGQKQNGEMLCLPYLAHYIWALLGVLAAESLPDATFAERYAWAAEIMRSWASFGVYTSMKDAGIDQDDIGKMAAMRVLNEPIPMGVIAKASAMRAEVLKKARESGEDIESIVAKVVEANRPKHGGAVRGEPSDDDIAF